MALKKHRPMTAGHRFRATPDYSEISKEKPNRKGTEKKLKAPKKLLKVKKRCSGRNSYGRITVRRRGGGHQKKIRVIDFKRDKVGVPGVVEAIDYDPNRSARIALIKYEDGERRYIICPQGVEVGRKLLSGPDAEIKAGNSLQIKDIPVGELIHNIELRPGAGGAMVRTAGGSAQLMAKTGLYAQVRLPSGEQRKVLQTCRATLGTIGNTDHANRVLGKAGASRWIGRRPKVRGVAMNPVDHPHGGGEGKTSGGRHPVSPWGKGTKGLKTRKNKATDKFIVRRRSKKKR